MTWQWMSIISVWVIATLGVVLVGILTVRGPFFTWLPIVLGGVIIATFCIQLAIRRKEGFVVRVVASVGGSVVILAVATAVLALLS